MKLTPKNYFSTEANKHYFSNSQLKGFMTCEAKEMAKIRGEWVFETTAPMMIGKYVHAWNEGCLDQFKEENKDALYTKAGKLRADFEKADDIIEVIKKDPLLMLAISGKKEQIFTANLFGAPFKIVIDSYFKKERRFGDLKIINSLSAKFWSSELNSYQNTFQNFGYFTQMAVYAEVERLANGRANGDYFEPFLAVITKEEYADKVIVSFVSDSESLEEFITRELSYIESYMARAIAIKSGEIAPSRCESCDYCRSTKMLTGTRHYTSFDLY